MSINLKAMIDQLNDIIEHPSTNEHLRDAARRKKDLLEAKIADSSEAIARAGGIEYYQLPERVYGAKADTTRYIPLKDICVMIRNDIKLAMRLAKNESKYGEVAIPSVFDNLPKGLKITVSKADAGTAHSININVRNIPESWGWNTITDHPDFRPGVKVYEPTEALETLGRALHEIWFSYNWDGSDAMVDYFDVNYHGGVNAMRPSGFSTRIGHP